MISLDLVETSCGHKHIDMHRIQTSIPSGWHNLMKWMKYGNIQGQSKVKWSSYWGYFFGIGCRWVWPPFWLVPSFGWGSATNARRISFVDYYDPTWSEWSTSSYPESNFKTNQYGKFVPVPHVNSCQTVPCSSTFKNSWLIHVINRSVTAAY